MEENKIVDEFWEGELRLKMHALQHNLEKMIAYLMM